jgi:hypothetical protein
MAAFQENREAVAKALVERAVDVLDQNAVSRGHLVGCNATFLETREARSDSSVRIDRLGLQPNTENTMT